ncbi:MAG: hypothetical protein KKA42_01745 [candidate division Zixibacteria bacterium]|nr:hypothetical protein [candidate division Zixibacteria bacterium]
MMPCNDITEHLCLRLDSDERVVGYELSKVTCGGKVAGRGLIRDWVKYKSINEVLEFRPPAEPPDADPHSPNREFLRLKHLITIQSAVAAYLGIQDNRHNAQCEITGIDYTPDGVEIRAVISITNLSKNIKACGGCGSKLDSPA